MSYRVLPLWCLTLCFAFTGLTLAQDQSAMWNAAKRWKLGLDGATARPTTETPGTVTDNPPNTPDIAIFVPSANAQSENSIGVNPANPNQLMVSTNGRIPGSNPVVHQTWAFSTDAGATWPFQSEDLPPNIIDSFGDPVAFFDVGGKAYFCTLGSPGGIYFVTTTDLGATWSARSNGDLLNSTNDDKQHACTDHSGTYPNNVYVAWTDFGVTGTPVQFSRSTDRGATWGSRTTLAIGSNRGQGVHISTGPNGEVYVMWAHYTTGTAEVGIGFAKSTDGGATFSTPVIAYPISGIRTSNGGIVALNNTRASSFPYFDVDRSNGPRSGWIYAVTPELVSGQADVFVRRSTDGGTTWSSSIQVNGPDVGTGKWQWMASIAVDQITGGITVSYNSKDTTGTVSADSLFNRYAAYSADGGATWENFVISDVRTALRPQGTPNTNANYNGDYNETAAWGGKAWPIWTDRRTGTNKVYLEIIAYADPVDPNPPANVSAFSDFSMPTSMLLRWTNPTTLVNGDPIGPFVVRIKRNDVQIAERPGTDSSYTDTGLTDGIEYTYAFQTRLTATDSLSFESQTSWRAGCALIPKTPTGLAVTGSSGTGYKLIWSNPSQQIDGTRLDDLAGIRVYRDGVLLTTLTRTSADTARADSTTDTPPAGFHTYYLTAIDNELPLNESGQSNTGATPADLPINDQFAAAGVPNTNIWATTNVDANDLGLNEPSAPYSLNLNGSPTSNTDNIESRPIDLTGQQGAGIALAYLYQPGGTGDRPEAADSLIVEFRNNLGQWIAIRKYPGIASTVPIPEYAFEAVGVDGVDPLGGTFFYNGFSFRFRSRGTAGTLDDDWFVDDVFFGIPSGTANIGASGVIAPAGQVSNNIPLNPVIRILNASAVQAGVYTVNVNITGPGTAYSATQIDSNLAAGASRNVSVLTPFTPNAVGQWTVRGWTQLAGDPNPANDTTTSIFFAVSPLMLPVQETFADSGDPNPLMWTNINGHVNADGASEPSEPYSLNLAGNPTGTGLDTVTSLTIDLSSVAGSGVTLAYWDQPAGAGDPPEAADSLVVEALNNLGTWVAIQKLPGSATRPFQFRQFNMDSVNAGGGTFFHSGFKFRFRSRAQTGTTTPDDWFVDDIFFGIPSGTPEMVVSGQLIEDTVLVGKRDSTSYAFTIANSNPFATPLNYTITEQPIASWLSVSPAAGIVNGGNTGAIRAIIDFTGATPGMYTTQLIVGGNDPANPSDTVNVSFLVNAAPAVSVSPDSFQFSLSGGDSILSSVIVRNTGLGPLTYVSAVEGGYAGQTDDNVGNSSLSLGTSSGLMRGGVVQVTTTVQLLEIRTWLIITASRELRYVVYENTTGTSFTKIFEAVIANSGTGGPQWYSSGPVNVLLEAGRRYAIGIDWPALSGLTYYWQASAPVPVPISFGSLTGGLAGTVYPPPATITQGATSSLYYTQLATASGRWLSVTSNGSGTVQPGDSTQVGFKVTTDLLPTGTATASLLINNNDPLRSIVSIPVRVDVATGVEERPGIPESFELSQNYPNPFNPVTRIAYALPRESTVRLKVYNLLGQQVATLLDQQRSAGFFSVEWDGTNGYGHKVSSGVYFYRFEATAIDGSEDFTSLKKMILLK